MMKEGMRNPVTKRPFSKPKSMPRIKTIMMTRGAGRPTSPTSPAVITAPTPMREPTDRSMTPQKSPKAIPTEAKPRVVIGMVMSWRLVEERNESDIRRKTTNRVPTPTVKAPSWLRKKAGTLTLPASGRIASAYFSTIIPPAQTRNRSTPEPPQPSSLYTLFPCPDVSSLAGC